MPLFIIVIVTNAERRLDINAGTLYEDRKAQQTGTYINTYIHTHIYIGQAETE